ncbi:5-carboxymethyl-2-hydroxymuconate Delta-isomerase [Peribacillus simplex]|uniref:5-carboxymethyl-2-hydroxymuconate Delta-isomerase n=1 Tax=Peribacillus simplex TaxID=1478 RepID=UPI0024C174BC|nr:5-carboxymethyl-2-hydroxymuconate Delta-isomerase [Peribacillus simplex]WHY59328.1 5-carboxymethyl-2-hydroxymuconate Delta-isomerase [Peribacillus simplex]
MPHIIVEYTDNLRKEADIPNLLKELNSVLISRSDIFPTGGIRSRAFELKDYRIADGAENDAFVHTILKIGSGRSDLDKKGVCDELFEVIKGHFTDLFARRYLALSMELIEFIEAGTYKHNNIHKRFRNS